jgi:centromeric protein E
MLEMQLARTALKERIEHLNRLILSSKSLGVNGRSFSSLSYKRSSIFSHASDMRPMSIRSTASHATLEVPSQHHSHASFPPPQEGSEEDDSVGSNGDGIASPTVQIQALQADLADRNRYIATLEKRLLQARRSSHSRVSMSLSHKLSSSEDGGLIATIAEKDSQISSLRGQLEDKERMIAALTSARKKNESAHDFGSDGSPGSRRTPSYQRSESSSVNIVTTKTSPQSPRLPFPPAPKSPGKNIEEMTRMLDEMITGRVDQARRGNATALGEGR